MLVHVPVHVPLVTNPPGTLHPFLLKTCSSAAIFSLQAELEPHFLQLLSGVWAGAGDTAPPTGDR